MVRSEVCAERVLDETKQTEGRRTGAEDRSKPAAIPRQREQCESGEEECDGGVVPHRVRDGMELDEQSRLGVPPDDHDESEERHGGARALLGSLRTARHTCRSTGATANDAFSHWVLRLDISRRPDGKNPHIAPNFRLGWQATRHTREGPIRAARMPRAPGCGTPQSQDRDNDSAF
jgi:hypothetical protein